MPERVKSTQQKLLNKPDAEQLSAAETHEAPVIAGNQALQTALAAGAADALHAAQHATGNQALQRLAQGAASAEADMGERIRNKAGKGQSLDSGVQRTLQTAMGADLSNVRVHTDGEADEMSRSVGALAFTTGSDIFFSQGAYDPSSTDGMRTLAHEATHVVQQAAGPVAGTQTDMGVAISDPSDRFEREAEAKAETVVANTGAPAAPVQGRFVQRAGAEEEEPLQGRFVQRKPPVAVNDDAGLEHEADVMGSKAISGKKDEPAQGRFVQRAGPEEEMPAQGRFVQRAAPEEEALQGRSIQRAEEEEPMQGRFVQRAEEEEPMQGRFIQRAEEEEPMQGRFIQRAGPEEELPAQGRFVQRAQEEESLQGRFVQRAEEEEALQARFVQREEDQVGGTRKAEEEAAGPAAKRAKA